VVVTGRSPAAASPPCAAPPSPAFVTEPTRPIAGQRTTLDAGGSTDTTGPIAAYEWDLDGDGTFEVSGSSVRRRLSFTAGQHDVELRVVDADGESARLPRTLIVTTRGAIRACARLARGANVIAGTERSAARYPTP
jgi:hypothetical protein